MKVPKQPAPDIVVGGVNLSRNLAKMRQAQGNALEFQKALRSSLKDVDKVLQRLKQDVGRRTPTTLNGDVDLYCRPAVGGLLRHMALGLSTIVNERSSTRDQEMYLASKLVGQCMKVEPKSVLRHLQQISKKHTIRNESIMYKLICRVAEARLGGTEAMFMPLGHAYCYSKAASAVFNQYHAVETSLHTQLEDDPRIPEDVNHYHMAVINMP